MNIPQLLLPRCAYPEIDEGDMPVFFLGGPIRGGDDWQRVGFDLFCQRLNGKASEVAIAIPYYHKSLRSNKLVREIGADTGDGFEFKRQTLWERHYLRRAAKKLEKKKRRGCAVFWLPEESTINPRDDNSGGYGRDSYGEIGELRGQMMHDPDINLVIGAERGFPGLSQMQVNFEAALDRPFRIYSSLVETVDAAIRQALF